MVVAAHSTCSASTLPLLLRLCYCIAMSQSEAAIRRAGAVVALAAASVLMAMGFPAVEERAHVVLALHAVLLLGCAAVLLSPAHGAVADLARRRRATEASRGTTSLGASARAPAGLLRWLGFAGILLYVLYVAGDVAARNKAAAEAVAAWLDTVRDFLLFLMFLVGVWAVCLSMVSGRAVPPPRSSAVAAVAEEEDPDGVEVNAMAPARVVVDSKVWNIHSFALTYLESLKISRLIKDLCSCSY